MNFPQRLRELREKAGLKQTDLAKMFKISRGAVCGWESGKNEPDTETLKGLARIFGVPVDYLLGEDELAGKVAGVMVHKEVAQMFRETDWRRLPPHEKQIIESVVRSIIDEYGN